MELRYLSSEDVVTYYEELNQLLHFCMEASCSFPVEESFYERKLAGLQNYLNQGRAYVIGALENGKLLGFYWIYELGEGVQRKMHVAYVAVMPEARGRGICSLMEKEAQQKAHDLGIRVMEMIVSTGNPSVVEFRKQRHGYSVTNVIMEKELSV